MKTEELQAGRELDRLIAEKVFGQYLRVAKDITSKGPTSINLPHYSSSIAAAWDIVERLRKKDFLLYIQTQPTGIGETDFLCRCVFLDNPWQEYLAVADSAPLAICRAALAAVKASPAPQPAACSR